MFFFSSRRRHTRCSRDWSSDVCSSDLEELPAGEQRRRSSDRVTAQPLASSPPQGALPGAPGTEGDPFQTGGSKWRWLASRSEERRVGKRVDLGCGRIIKKK